MTCRNGVWYGCDLTHPFLDDRSTVVRGPSVNNSIEQEATLRLPIANVVMPQLLPPAHMVIQPRMQAPPQPQPPPLQLPIVQSLAFSSSHLASGPGATHDSELNFQQELEGSSQMYRARVHSAPPFTRNVAAPDMSHRTPSEQAVIQTLQAVANYPDSRDFVETISRRLPCLQTLIGTPTQVEGCSTTTREPFPSTSAATTRALSPSLARSWGANEPRHMNCPERESPTSRPS